MITDGSGRVVPEYQFFRLNPAGLIDSADRLRLPDDDAAFAHARALRDEGRVEIWSGGRKIGVTTPTRIAR